VPTRLGPKPPPDRLGLGRTEAGLELAWGGGEEAVDVREAGVGLVAAPCGDGDEAEGEGEGEGEGKGEGLAADTLSVAPVFPKG
jgi:hypothetical protein